MIFVIMIEFKLNISMKGESLARTVILLVLLVRLSYDVSLMIQYEFK